eukprot:scpid100499/ scgid21754/ Insulin-like growth factor-binding protein complex acid labile subunit
MKISKMGRQFVLVIMIVAALSARAWTADCDSIPTCTCNEMELICRRTMQPLTRLPDDIPDTITKMVVSPNDLDHLVPGQLDNLTSLKILNLGYNMLTAIPGDFLAYNVLLEELYLQVNRITFLNDSLFQNLTNLRILHVYSNPIDTIEPPLFAGLSNLKSIALDNIKAKVFDWAIFDSLTNLEQIGLRLNSFDFIPDNVTLLTVKLQKLYLPMNELSTLPPGLFDN